MENISEMDIVSSTDFVNVAVRIKPVPVECSRCLHLMNKTDSIIYVPERAQAFTFDKVFDEDADQETLYKTLVKPLVEKVKDGYNCTVFAYGQTGTGKTYTMGCNPDIKSEDAGFAIKVIEDVFSQRNENTESEVLISFLEIYNEKVYDLLGNHKIQLLVKEFQVQGLSKNYVKDVYEAKRLLEMGNKNRRIGETKQNTNSSRSHAIFTIHYITKFERYETVAKLHLVDLAGSENVKKTGNQGSQLYEGININKGLLCIGQVINALSKNSNFVPYRQSTITTILQDSLNRNNYVTLVACISPNQKDINETVYTLDFASRTKQLKNLPKLNKFKKDNPHLFSKSVTKYTPRNLTSSIKKDKLAELDVNSLPVSNNTTVYSTPFVENMENQPHLRWSQLETTVQNIVRNELKQYKVNQSTPIENYFQQNLEETNTIRKALNFSSPLAEKLEEEKKEIFKVPEIRNHFKTKRISSVNKKASPLKVRRSLRLSLKKNDITMNSSVAFFDETFKRRKSVRLMENSTKKELSVEEKSVTNSNTKKINFNENVQRHKTISSPKTAHRDRVLKIIKNGNEKHLQTLATIGPKTARLLITFRDVNGKFSKISDLRKLPFWGEKAYERFCKANFLL